MPRSYHFLLFCLALCHSKNKKHVRIKHSRYRKDFFDSLSALTRRSATLQGIIYTNRARIFWDLLHPHVGREFWIRCRCPDQ